MDQPETSKSEKGKTSSNCPLGMDWEEAFCIYERLIASESEALQIRAVVELARLSKSAPEAVLEQTVPHLVKLLRFSSHSHSTSIQEASVYSLCRLSRQSSTMCELVGQSGAISLLLFLLPQSEGRFQRLLVKCLRNIVTCSNRNRVILVRNGGLDIIVDLLGSHYDAGARRYLVEILTALMMLKEVRLVLISLGSLPLLIESARSGKMASRARAAQAIGQIGSTRRGKRMLIDLGVIPVLVELLRDGDMPAKLTASNSLGIISSHVDYLRLVAEAGAIPLLVEQLKGPNPLGREISEDVFCILAVVEENAIEIAGHLVTILRGTNEVAKVAAADVLWDLSSYQHSISVVRASGAIPLLLELLQVGSDEVREKASGAIAQLSYDRGDRGALADAGVIPILIMLLQEESEELKDNVVEALINFSEDPVFRDRMSDAFDIPTFHDIQERLLRIRSSDELTMRSWRRMSIEQFTHDPDYR